MTDRELLELAGKAAGLKGCMTECPFGNPLFEIDCGNGHFPQWSPLTDDGDEARLESKLSLHVEWFDGCVTVRKSARRVFCLERYIDHGGDKQRARRYAGVRAAGGIEVAMEAIASEAKP